MKKGSESLKIKIVFHMMVLTLFGGLFRGSMVISLGTRGEIVFISLISVDEN